ncbi:unnamed protein product [Allacma fusca]|uniref:WAP domain-containing protein n=1 Tax=Allacma fusca TaxID=39272 RepID=A0A8J2K7D3_9HEXA|nr:unnamed protein product [Allacma fusca]
MMLAANITFIFMLMEISTNLVVSQFSNGYRNWFFAPRNVPLYPLCLPDGSHCLRMTDCCSSHCNFDLEQDRIRCTPSPCGCPQPPWSPEPIDENCLPYARMCYFDHECCSGYCLRSGGYHGGGRRCFWPPCTTPCWRSDLLGHIK